MAKNPSKYTLTGCAAAASILIAGCGGGGDAGDFGDVASQKPFIESSQNHGTGDITFVFNFSEAVTGFELSDVQIVSNGTPGAFNIISSTQATFVVQPGDLALPVPVHIDAGAFVDLAGNPNVLAADFTHFPGGIDDESPTVTVCVDGESPFTFDCPAFEYKAHPFGGVVGTIVSAADAASAASGATGDFVQLVKSDTAEVWGGVAFEPLVSGGLAFNSSATRMSVRVWTPIPADFLLKVEHSTGSLDGEGNPTVFAEATAHTDLTNQWHTLHFNFPLGSSSPNLDLVDTSKQYDRVIFSPGNGASGPDAAATFFIDNISNPKE